MSTIGGNRTNGANRNANLRSAAVQRSLNSHAMVSVLHDRDASRDRDAATAAIAGRHDRNEPGGWRHRHGWVGSLFWPFASEDVYDYTMRGDGDDPAFWGYGYNDIYAGIFVPYGDDDRTGYLRPGGTTAPARHGLRATADPATPQANAHPATPQAATHPATPQAATHPAKSQANADPATPQANAHSTTPQANARPTAPQTNGHSTTPQANARPTAPQADARPITPQADAHPATPQATAHPATPQATAHPATPQATANPATKLATANPATKLATANPATPQATANPATKPATANPATKLATANPATPQAAARAATDRRTQMCGGDSRDVAGLPIDEIQRAIAPDETQRAALDDLANASVKAAQDIRAACPGRIAATAPARLGAMQQRIEAMIAAVGTVEPALDKFYGLLNDQQKAQFDAVGPNQRSRSAAQKTGGALTQNCGAAQRGANQWPTAEIESRLHPTDKQRASLTALMDASAKANEILIEACQPEDAMTPPGRLAAAGNRLAVMRLAIKTVLAALDDFYDGLTEEQKASFEEIGPGQTAAAFSTEPAAGAQAATPTDRRPRRRPHASIGDRII